MRTCEIPLCALNKCREPLIQSILAVDTFRFLPSCPDGWHRILPQKFLSPSPSFADTAAPMYSHARQVGWRQRRYIGPMLLRSQIILLLIWLLCGDRRQDRSFQEQADPIHSPQSRLLRQLIHERHETCSLSRVLGIGGNCIAFSPIEFVASHIL